MSISTAVDIDRISRIVGYKLTKGNFSNVTPNLPQRISILGEANTANQASFTADAPQEITTVKQAADLYGYGSPLHIVMRILRPLNGGGVGSIPTIVYPQAETGVAAVRDITPTGTADANGIHTVVINGRRGVDGGSYDFQVTTGDNVATICDNIVAAINSVLGTPCIATDSTTKVVATSKWTGLTSNGLTITIDTNGADCGITYAVTSPTAGSGTPDISASLALFQNEWNTIVINTYDTATLDDLAAYNGIPDPENPTGRYQGIIMKPFIALFGSRSNAPLSITATRKDDVTNALCPAPYSAGLPMEAAANMAVLFAKTAQENPHLDVNAKFYPDMPIPSNGNIGTFADYEYRDAYVKGGSSTVMLVSGKYQVQDFVTCYHPDGEVPPQFRYCRNLMLDFNIKYGYRLLEEIHVVDHAIATDTDIVSVGNVIKPKQWKQIVGKYADELGKRALIADVPFMKNSIEVGLSTTNPDRLETFFRYKRTGIARIASTTAEAGFNFGTL